MLRKTSQFWILLPTVVASLAIISSCGLESCDGAETSLSVKKLVPIDGNDGDTFGNSVDLFGDTLVVGTKWHQHGFSNRGTAYVYRNIGGQWTFLDELNASDGQGAGNFGDAVAINGSTIVVGDYQHSYSNPFVRAGGAAYVFEESDMGWVEVAKLVPPTPGHDHQFGSAVDVNGENIVVGAPGANSAAYVFSKNGGVWQYKQKLLPSFPDGFGLGGSFGGDVAVGNGFALVAAASQDAFNTNSGAVFAYEETVGGWIETDVLIPSEPIFRGSFGAAIDVDGSTAIIGRPNGVPTSTPIPGVAYIFEKSGDEWIESAILQASDSTELNFFGAEVALFGNHAAVTANAGRKVYLFENIAGYWQETTILDIENGDAFGAAVSLGDRFLAVADQLDDQSAPNAGAVHVFEIPEPTSSAVLVSCSSMCFLRSLTIRKRLKSR